MELMYSRFISNPMWAKSSSSALASFPASDSYREGKLKMVSVSSPIKSLKWETTTRFKYSSIASVA